MTYEEKKVVIDAAIVLKEHCLEHKYCDGCVFYVEENVLTCPFYKNNAADFKIPTLSRWTKEDVALARALKTDGIVSILRISNGEINFFGTMYAGELLNSNMFLGLDYDEAIDLDTIIKEAEG